MLPQERGDWRMQQINGRLVYSATDLVGFLECRHLANLGRAAVAGHLARPIHGSGDRSAA